jgi:YHS domain-containing protein
MDGLLSLLIFAGLFFLMMRFGCGTHVMHGRHGAHHGHSRHSGQGPDELKHIDPVCGMHVDPQEGYGKMQGGQLFRFCSKACLEEFEVEPSKYLTQKKEEAA